MRIDMEAGTHSLWVSELLRNLGHEVIVANVRELRAITHNDRKSDHVDPRILRPISHRSVAMQQALTLIRAREVLVRLRTATVNAVRGLAKPCGCRLLACSTASFPKRAAATLPENLLTTLRPLLARHTQQ